MPVIPDISFQLPKLQGINIQEHFRNIAEEQSQDYMEYLKDLAGSKLPSTPKSWNYHEGEIKITCHIVFFSTWFQSNLSGWTKYNSDGTSEIVNYPDDRALVFDVEVCMNEGSYPTLATAVSSDAWYENS